MAENGPARENDSNQHNDKGLELSGISLTPDLLFFFFLPCLRSLGVDR